MSEAKTEVEAATGRPEQKGVRKCANMSASTVYEPTYSPIVERYRICRAESTSSLTNVW